LQSVCLPVCLSVCVCVRLSASLSLELLHQFSQNLLWRSPVAMARSGSIAIRYALPVLWMTSRLAIIGHMVTSGIAIPSQSLMSMNALFII